MLYAFDRLSGELSWTTDVPEPALLRQDLLYPDLVPQPGAGPDRLVVAQMGGNVVFATRDPVGTVAVDTADGHPVWQVATDWGLVGAWWIEDEQVVLVTSDGWRRDSPREPRIMRIDPVDGSSLSEDFYSGTTNSNVFDTVLSPWSTNVVIDRIGDLEVWAHCEPLLEVRRFTTEDVCDQEAEPEMWLEAIDAGTGEAVWQRSVDREYRSLATTGDTLYLAAAPDSIPNSRGSLFGHSPVIALDVATGEERWTANFSGGLLFADVAGDALYVIHRPDERA